MTVHDLWKVSLVVTLSATAQGASAASNISAATIIGGTSFVPSSNVTISAAADDNHFVAYGQHQQGNRVYFITDGTVNVHYGSKEIGSMLNVSPLPSQAVPSGWSTL